MFYFTLSIKIIVFCFCRFRFFLYFCSVFINLKFTFMKKSKSKPVEFSNFDWDLMNLCKLASMNLVILRHFHRCLLKGYLNGTPILIKKEVLDCIFRFLQQTEFGNVNANKKSKICRTRSEARK